MSANLSFRKPPYIFHDEFVSWSGKYFCFLGHHYHTTAHECWVIGAINVITGVVREWHINCMPAPVGVTNICKDPKAEALIAYQSFQQKMERKPDAEETQDADQEWDTYVKPFLARERERKNLKPEEPPVV